MLYDSTLLIVRLCAVIPIDGGVIRPTYSTEAPLTPHLDCGGAVAEKPPILSTQGKPAI